MIHYIADFTAITSNKFSVFSAQTPSYEVYTILDSSTHEESFQLGLIGVGAIRQKLRTDENSEIRATLGGSF